MLGRSLHGDPRTKNYAGDRAGGLDEMQKMVEYPDWIHYKSKCFVRKLIGMNDYIKTVIPQIYLVPVNQINIKKNTPPFLRYEQKLAFQLVSYFTYS